MSVLDDMTFEREFPSKDVAEHEVFISFTNDYQAAMFFDWWNEKGERDFEKYAEEKE